MDIDAKIPYLEMGWGFALGLSVGYALKKSLKIMLLVVGLGFIFVFVLENNEVVKIDDTHLKELIESSIVSIDSWITFLQERIGKYESGQVSALVGFIFGLKLG